MLRRRLERRPQHRVAEAHVPSEPDVLAVGPTERHEVGQPIKERTVDRCAVEIDDPDDAAHNRKAWPREDRGGRGRLCLDAGRASSAGEGQRRRSLSTADLDQPMLEQPLDQSIQIPLQSP
jgi:hypothetical protein